MFMAVWDIDRKRGLSLKERLDMISEREAVVYTGDWDGEGGVRHDVFFVSIGASGELELKIARSVRLTGEETHLLLVSERNRDISPFLRPAIRPSGVIFRPVRNAEIRDMLYEISSEIERLTHDGEADVFMLKADNISYRIPLRDILFFETIDRKVRLHTAGQEICYYDSIKNLTAVLPDYFLRCHKSYLVNTFKIEKLDGDKMEAILTGGYRIPYSRTRRNAVRQIFNGKKGGA